MQKDQSEHFRFPEKRFLMGRRTGQSILIGRYEIDFARDLSFGLAAQLFRSRQSLHQQPRPKASKWRSRWQLRHLSVRRRAEQRPKLGHRLRHQRSYAFGLALKVIPSKMWKSPKSGNLYPWYGRIETPQGTFYYEPTHTEQEGYGLAGPYIEGVIQLRQGSPKGPIVATGFTEMIMLTEPFEDGSDPSMGPPISRPLPNNPSDPWSPQGPRTVPATDAK